MYYADKCCLLPCPLTTEFVFLKTDAYICNPRCQNYEPTPFTVFAGRKSHANAICRYTFRCARQCLPYLIRTQQARIRLPGESASALPQPESGMVAHWKRKNVPRFKGRIGPRQHSIGSFPYGHGRRTPSGLPHPGILRR